MHRNTEQHSRLSLFLLSILKRGTGIEYLYAVSLGVGDDIVARSGVDSSSHGRPGQALERSTKICLLLDLCPM